MKTKSMIKQSVSVHIGRIVFVQLSMAGGVTKVGTLLQPFLGFCQRTCGGNGRRIRFDVRRPVRYVLESSVLATMNESAVMFDHTPWLPGSILIIRDRPSFEGLGTIGISTTYCIHRNACDDL